MEEGEKAQKELGSQIGIIAHLKEAEDRQKWRKIAIKVPQQPTKATGMTLDTLGANEMLRLLE